MEPIAAAVIAVMTWFGLGLQLWLLLPGPNGWLSTVLYFLGFFTILSNTLMATVLTAPLLGLPGARWFAGSSVRTATAVYMAILAAIYVIVLQELWDPTGAQAIADDLLHKIDPILYVLYWFAFVDKRSLEWRSIPAWLIYPLSYFGVAMLRGLATGWYPYPFIDASALGLPRVLVNATGLTVVFAILSALVIGGSRALATKAPSR